MPAAGFLTPAAFVIADLLIYWSGFEVVWKLGIVLVIGYVLIGIGMVFDKHRPPLDWKSAVWLPVWLVGLGLISWQGQYGPGNTGNIPFWWDMLIVAVFSVVIFYWAMATRLPREEMLKLVGAPGWGGTGRALTNRIWSHQLANGLAPSRGCGTGPGFSQRRFGLIPSSRAGRRCQAAGAAPWCSAPGRPGPRW